MSEYLQPSPCIDSKNEQVIEFARLAVGSLDNNIEKAKALFYRVRDFVLYDPFKLTLNPNNLKASHVLASRRAYCVPKAVLLAACARAQGIPARLGFADVKNHFSNERLHRIMRTDVFAFHGYTELFLNKKWVKATPAFDRRVCRVFGTEPLSFDGKNDAIFQPYSPDGSRSMTYLKYHGEFADIPFDLFEQQIREHYPHLFDEDFVQQENLGGLFVEEKLKKQRTAS